MTLDYVAHHLLGAWKLLRGNEEGFDHFDLTEEGFWRSFAVMALVLPAITVGMIASHNFLIGYAAVEPTFSFAVPLPVYAIVELVLVYAGWLAYLAVMIRIAHIFGATGRYSVFVISYNWATLLIVLLIFPLNVSQMMGWISVDVALLLELVFGIMVLVYFWFIATVSLRISRLDAAAVVAMETVIYLALGRVANLIYSVVSTA